MSLRTQLTLLVAFSALLSFVGNFAITLDNTRQYLAAQLDTHAQDTATSLGLSLSTRHAIEDPLLMESMVDAIFDRGYYQEITVVNAAAEPVLERIQPVTVHDVPTWFVRWFSLATPRRHVETGCIPAGCSIRDGAQLKPRRGRLTSVLRTRCWIVRRVRNEEAERHSCVAIHRRCASMEGHCG